MDRNTGKAWEALASSVRDLPELISAPQVAELLQVSRTTVYNLVKSYELDGVRIGKRILIYKSSFLDFLREKSTDRELY